MMTERVFVVGQDRNEPTWVAHIYEHLPGGGYRPMCRRGWNRDGGYGISIFRGHSPNGVCKVCQRNQAAGKPAMLARDRETKWL
jgi:hypothetical protein